jgi:hypothetical protein
MKGMEIHNTKGGKQNMACLHQWYTWENWSHWW